MPKKFNITGTCIPEKHYMVDISEKIQKIFSMIEEGLYFTINRPRQFGKTTTLFHLKNFLQIKPNYLIASISFEGVGDKFFENEETFCPKVLRLMADSFGKIKTVVKDYLYEISKTCNAFDILSKEISDFCTVYDSKIVLLIDEVDKSSNNQLFLNFLGMLRNMYLLREQGEDKTFNSVILAGVHDIKNLKIKLRPDAEQKFNSPWNIATEFTVDLSFNPKEIGTMLNDYVKEKNIEMDIPRISERIYHYTSGYPFLVSRICKEIDERILSEKGLNNWSLDDIDNAVRIITNEKNTNYESITTNIENNEELYNFIVEIVVGNSFLIYNPLDPIIQLAEIHGIIKKSNKVIVFHNRIYEDVITHYITSKLSRGKYRDIAMEAVQSQFLKPDGRLDFEKVLLKFQEVIKEKHSKSELLKSNEFLEKDLRLLFLVFLKPIINGIGFSFKEVETGEEKRMDIVVIFKDEKFVVELKLWRCMEYHTQGIARLKDYMLKEGVQKGYMLIMDKTRSKEFVVEQEEGLMMVWI